MSNHLVNPLLLRLVLLQRHGLHPGEEAEPVKVHEGLGLATVVEAGVEADWNFSFKEKSEKKLCFFSLYRLDPSASLRRPG